MSKAYGQSYVPAVQNGDSTGLEEDGEIYRELDEAHGIQGKLNVRTR